MQESSEVSHEISAEQLNTYALLMSTELAVSEEQWRRPYFAWERSKISVMLYKKQ